MSEEARDHADPDALSLWTFLATPWTKLVGAVVVLLTIVQTVVAFMPPKEGEPSGFIVFVRSGFYSVVIVLLCAICVVLIAAHALRASRGYLRQSATAKLAYESNDVVLASRRLEGVYAVVRGKRMSAKDFLTNFADLLAQGVTLKLMAYYVSERMKLEYKDTEVHRFSHRMLNHLQSVKALTPKTLTVLMDNDKGTQTKLIDGEDGFELSEYGSRIFCIPKSPKKENTTSHVHQTPQTH